MTASATFGGGCFWCTEAAFKEVPGVESVTSGYAGGHEENPTYEAVCAETTGHAEVIQVEYDEDTISYPELLEVFFTIHDPTQLNRQGPDHGTQYRSIILAHDDEQLETAQKFVVELETQGLYDREGQSPSGSAAEPRNDEIVTEIEPLEAFYEAEEHHQDYFEKNPNDAYCSFNAAPKVEKVREKFAGTQKAGSGATED